MWQHLKSPWEVSQFFLVCIPDVGFIPFTPTIGPPGAPATRQWLGAAAEDAAAGSSSRAGGVGQQTPRRGHRHWDAVMRWDDGSVVGSAWEIFGWRICKTGWKIPPWSSDFPWVFPIQSLNLEGILNCHVWSLQDYLGIYAKGARKRLQVTETIWSWMMWGFPSWVICYPPTNDDQWGEPKSHHFRLVFSCAFPYFSIL